MGFITGLAVTSPEVVAARRREIGFDRLELNGCELIWQEVLGWSLSGPWYHASSPGFERQQILGSLDDSYAILSFNSQAEARLHSLCQHDVYQVHLGARPAPMDADVRLYCDALRVLGQAVPSWMNGHLICRAVSPWVVVEGVAEEGLRGQKLQ